MCVSEISRGLGTARAGQRTLKGVRLTPRAGFALCSRAPGGGRGRRGGGRALPLPGLLRAPCPGFQFPDTAFCSGLAGRPEGFSGSVSACHSLRASVCPSGGFLCILTPLPAAEFLSWSRHLPAWAGPCWSSVVWVPLHSQRAGSLHLGVGALGPGASRRAGVSRGLYLPCVAWCLWLCSLGEKVPPGLHALPPAVARTLWVSPGVCAVTADPPHVG